MTYINALPTEYRPDVLSAVVNYALYGTEPELDNAFSQMAFENVRKKVDLCNMRYENGCKGAKHGKKGGAPMGNQNARKTTYKKLSNIVTYGEKTTPKQPQNNPKQKEQKVSPAPLSKNRKMSKVLFEREERAGAREVASLSRFFIPDRDVSDDEYAVLQEIAPFVEANEYLQQWRYVSKYLAYAERIKIGYYDAYKATAPPKASKDAQGYTTHEYTEEQLKSAFVNWEDWE